ncbi:hypothetical protein Pfo_010484 [Paulownia fortunei]|nr:hypothetical protein Pfo_010484 [Paulownia fortunei]
MGSKRTHSSIHILRHLMRALNYAIQTRPPSSSFCSASLYLSQHILQLPLSLCILQLKQQPLQFLLCHYNLYPHVPIFFSIRFGIFFMGPHFFLWAVFACFYAISHACKIFCYSPRKWLSKEQKDWQK